MFLNLYNYLFNCQSCSVIKNRKQPCIMLLWLQNKPYKILPTPWASSYYNRFFTRFCSKRSSIYGGKESENRSPYQFWKTRYCQCKYENKHGEQGTICFNFNPILPDWRNWLLPLSIIINNFALQGNIIQIKLLHEDKFILSSIM